MGDDDDGTALVSFSVKLRIIRGSNLDVDFCLGGDGIHRRRR